MIYTLFANSLWIVGLALLLASFSYHHYQAYRYGRTVRTQLRRRSFQIALYISLLLTCLGLAATSTTLVERIIWLLLALLAAAGTGHYLVSYLKNRVSADEQGR